MAETGLRIASASRGNFNLICLRRSWRVLKVRWPETIPWHQQLTHRLYQRSLAQEKAVEAGVERSAPP